MRSSREQGMRGQPQPCVQPRASNYRDTGRRCERELPVGPSTILAERPPRCSAASGCGRSVGRARPSVIFTIHGWYLHHALLVWSRPRILWPHEKEHTIQGGILGN
jgi:hypothetical protein